MIKRFLKKIDDLIQWTKKWHFFHVFIIPFYIVFFITLAIIFIFLCDYLFIGKFNYGSMMSYICALHTFSYLVFFILMLEFWVALIAQTLFSFINWYLYRNISVRSKFLLNNKRYNNTYVIGWIFTIICFILYKTCTHLIFNYVF